MTADPFEELRALKARLAYLESLVTQPEGAPVPPPKTLDEALGDHYAAHDGAKARAHALASWGPFSENAEMEKTIRGRLHRPEAYGPITFEEAAYVEQKAAHDAAKEQE